MLTEATHEATSSGAWNAISTIVVGVVSATGAWLVARTAGRAPGHIEPEPHPVQVPNSNGGTTSRDLAGESPALVGAIEDMAETLASMTRRLAAQAAIIDAERSYGDALEDHIQDMITGHASGIYPPWRPRPPRP